MSKRPHSRYCIAIVAGVLLALCIDLQSSAFTSGARLAIDDMISLVAYLFRQITHAITELAPTVVGCLVSAGLILRLVRWLNRHDDPRTARHPWT